MTVDQYLKESGRLIDFAENIKEQDPERSFKILTDVLKHHKRFIQRLGEQQNPQQQNA